MSNSEEKHESNKLCECNYENQVEDKFQKTGNRSVQYLAGVSVCICIIGIGTHRAWTSPSLPYLKSSNSKFLITDIQGTWIVSLLLIGDLVGSLVNPLFIDNFGRKYTMIIFTIPILISWLLIIYAENYIYLYIARLLAGIHQGAIINSSIIYITEIAEKEIRGTVFNFTRIAGSFGYFTCTALSAFLPFQIWNPLCMIISIIFFFISFFLPETPYFFFMKNRDDEGVKCLMKIRNITNSNLLDSEINDIKVTIMENKKFKNSALRQLLGDKQNRRDLLITSLMMMTQLFSGILAVNFYTEEILSYSDFSIKPGFQVMIVTGITVLACASTTLFIDKFERKVLFLYSGILCSISLGTIGLFFFMKLYLRVDVSSIRWLPLLGLVMYKVSYSLGFGPIPDLLLGELFPVEVKATAISFVVLTTSIFCFITAAGYEILNKAAGIYTTFWLFAISSIAGPILIFFITPKTKGKTLEEIQKLRKSYGNNKFESQKLNSSDFS